MSTMSDADELDERLFAAAEAGDLAAARAALAGGARATYARERGDGTFREVTPVLFVACARKDRELVALLLDHGADPDACRTDDDSWHQRDTCLRAAMPCLEIVALLLERGADPNQPSEAGESCRMPTHALTDAGGDTELTALLKRHGADFRKAPLALAERAREQEAAARKQRSVANILARPQGGGPRGSAKKGR